ncbi:DoxX family protein [Bradyrhizobium sp. RDM4]|uniref:DoxX family protein n=1 Tax=Bradyrhizobium sp. RDM4 TaxID=3378765 RepID=UPI0038FC9ABB
MASHKPLFPPAKMTDVFASLTYRGKPKSMEGMKASVAAEAQRRCARGLVISIHMMIIIAFFQSQFGYFWTVRGYEFALLWCLLCIAIVFRGGGRYSVDRLIGKEF